MKKSLLVAFVLIAFTNSFCSWEKKTLEKMSLREKIGQLFMIAVRASDKRMDALAESKIPYKTDPKYSEQMIKEYHVGGIGFVGMATKQELSDCIQKYQRMSKTPLLVGIDAEWGAAMRVSDVVKLPRSMTVSATNDDHMLYEVGHMIGQQCKELGAHINFGPVVDVNNNPKNPVIHDRSFGDDPQKVAAKASVEMRGLHDAGILVCEKHWLGHGDTDTDSHTGVPKVNYTRARLDAVEFPPFKRGIADGADAIMTAHIIATEIDPKNPATLSRAIITDILKKELGFKGLVITDGLGMKGVTDSYEPGELECAAFKSGNDILLFPLDVPKAVVCIEDAVKNGEISEQAIDASVLKILRAKRRMIIDKKRNSGAPAGDTIFTGDAIKKLKKDIYRAAATLVKGDLDTLREVPDEDREVIMLKGLSKAAKNFGVTQETLDQIAASKKAGKRVVVIVYGTPYSVALLQDADDIIVVYEDDPDAEEAARDVLAGTLVPRGVLPVKV